MGIKLISIIALVVMLHGDTIFANPQENKITELDSKCAAELLKIFENGLIDINLCLDNCDALTVELRKIFREGSAQEISDQRSRPLKLAFLAECRSFDFCNLDSNAQKNLIDTLMARQALPDGVENKKRARNKIINKKCGHKFTSYGKYDYCIDLNQSENVVDGQIREFFKILSDKSRLTEMKEFYNVCSEIFAQSDLSKPEKMDILANILTVNFGRNCQSKQSTIEETIQDNVDTFINDKTEYRTKECKVFKPISRTAKTTDTLKDDFFSQSSIDEDISVGTSPQEAAQLVTVIEKPESASAGTSLEREQDTLSEEAPLEDSMEEHMMKDSVINQSKEEITNIPSLIQTTSPQEQMDQKVELEVQPNVESEMQLDQTDILTNCQEEVPIGDQIEIEYKSLSPTFEKNKINEKDLRALKLTASKFSQLKNSELNKRSDDTGYIQAVCFDYGQEFCKLFNEKCNNPETEKNLESKLREQLLRAHFELPKSSRSSELALRCLREFDLKTYTELYPAAAKMNKVKLPLPESIKMKRNCQIVETKIATKAVPKLVEKAPEVAKPESIITAPDWIMRLVESAQHSSSYKKDPYFCVRVNLLILNENSLTQESAELLGMMNLDGLTTETCSA